MDLRRFDIRSDGSFIPTVGGAPASWYQFLIRLLCYGLDFLHQVDISCHTTEQLESIIASLPHDDYQVDGQHHCTWLIDALTKAANAISIDDVNERDMPKNYTAISVVSLSNGETKSPANYTLEHYMSLMTPSLFSKDRDAGPLHAWLWAYEGFKPTRVCDEKRMINCRLFGYVFWDMERLKGVNFMENLDFWRWLWTIGRLKDYTWASELDDVSFYSLSLDYRNGLRYTASTP
jgi:hypothetical protein